MTPEETLGRALRDIVGGGNVLDDPEVTARYRRDWTGRFHGPPTPVVRPSSTEQVAATITYCRDREVGIVPQGGNTGLVGGSVPLASEVVLSLDRLAGVESVTAHAGVLTAAAGTTIGDVQRAAREHGWDYGVDLASRDTATVGGTIATNACGTRAVRYGDTRHQVVGVEVVTGEGVTLSNLGGTLRDNTGYHLPSIVTGSEGTLGVVTRARLRLAASYSLRTTALLRFGSVGDAVLAAESIRGLLPTVESVELFLADGLELVCAAFDLAPPFTETTGAYVLVEAADLRDPTVELSEVVGSLASVADVAVAEDDGARRRLWRYREEHTAAISTVGIPHKLDVAVPPGSLAELVERAPLLVSSIAPRARTWLFGHGGESALHINITGVDPDDDTVDDAVLRLVGELHGTISAEHGIGRAKARWIELAHGPAELQLLGRIKAAFDPSGIMNPGVLLPRTGWSADG